MPPPRAPRRPATSAWLAALVVLPLALGGCGKDEPAPAPPPVVSPSPPPAPQAPPEILPTPAAAPTKLAPKPTQPVPEGSVSRWYEVRLDGQKMSSVNVVWAPSTWKGKPTIRDTTTSQSRSARMMAGTMDVFETESVSNLERGEDGTMWWMRSVTRSGDREDVAEITWTGDGYDLLQRAGEAEQRRRIDVAEPVPVEAEPVLGRLIAAGKAEVGAKFELRTLDWEALSVRPHLLEFVARENVEAEAGPVPTWKVRETDPVSKAETIWWIDDQGAFARVQNGNSVHVRVTQQVAEKLPVRPASFSITSPATPRLERIFSAERLHVDVHVRGDKDRPPPEFPASPWSRVESSEGSDERGWVFHTVLTAYDVPGATTTIPVTDARFAKDLEPTVLFCIRDPVVAATAKRVVAGETDARRAAQKIADFVFTLEKQSPAVGEATAREILRDMQGDCSEHATLFVALCRAAGLPARRCSGYVCVGSLWGAHAWAEIWVGAWIGVDPTTNDVGTAARYLFFGRDDDPTTHKEVVSQRAQGRMRFVATRLEEGDEVVDLADESTWKTIDGAAGRASQRLAGIEFRGLPSDWRVTWRGPAEGQLKGPGIQARIQVQADQGYRDLARHGGDAQDGPSHFAGAPAVFFDESPTSRTLRVSSRKRRITIQVALSGDDPEATFAAFEKAIAPTFAERPSKGD